MCGNGLPAGASFCSSCGAAVVAATTPPVDAGDVGKQPEPPIHESPIPSTRAVRADSAVAESISLRALAIAWWRRRGGWAKTGLIPGAIVLLLAPLSALGSSGGPPADSTSASPSPGSSSNPGATSDPGTSEPEELTVAAVTDGDTVRLSDGRDVQLAQISAPSVRQGDCFADKARFILSGLVDGATVKLVREPKLPRVDRYGQSVGYLIANGQNVNLMLVAEGAAAPYFYFGREGRYATRLVSTAKAAARAHTGLWGACSKTRLDPVHQLRTLGGRYKPPTPTPTCTAGYSPCLINTAARTMIAPEAAAMARITPRPESSMTLRVLTPTDSTPITTAEDAKAVVVAAVAVPAAVGAAAGVPVHPAIPLASSTTVAQTMTVQVAAETAPTTRRRASLTP
jgi:endonuclease YncB( thermonuclease family)